MIACFLAYFGSAALYIANEKFSFSTLNDAPFLGVNHTNISMSLSLMNDILGYVDGNILECEDVIEIKVIALSKAIAVNKEGNRCNGA